jgi:uncharacterized membrane protein YfcA
MELTTIGLLILAGLFAGFINTLAGSGSLITLPLLIFLGLPANVANGTNRIAVFLQSIVGLVKFQQKKVLDKKKGLYYTNIRLWNYIAFFFIGFYGGFIQLSTGILILCSLVLGANYDLIRANALKLLIIVLYSPIVIYIFYVNDQIDWYYGLVLAIGNVGGAWIAAGLALKKGVVFVRWILILAVIVSAIKLIFF